MPANSALVAVQHCTGAASAGARAFIALGETLAPRQTQLVGLAAVEHAAQAQARHPADRLGRVHRPSQSVG